IQQLDKVTQQNTSAAEEMASTSEELASQADQLQQAISYFRIEQTGAGGMAMASAPRKANAGKKTPGFGVADLQETIRAAAPSMAGKRPAKAKSGGFDLDLNDGGDELDSRFTRNGHAA
ncbi:methyl-accepting chemotaxis sensory transducer, partial [Aurantimonas sp. 22II-16-19i]